MKVMIRLYRKHDLDLISLYYSPEFAFTKAFKEVLINYVRGEYYRIQIPKTALPPAIRRVVPLHIILNEETEKDVIDWIRKINNGQRNSMLKNLFRSYIIGLNMDAYGNVGRDIFTAETSQVETYPRKALRRRAKEKQPKSNILLMTAPEPVLPGEEDSLDEFDALMGSF